MLVLANMSTLQDRMNKALEYRQSIASQSERVNKASLAVYCRVSTPSVSNWFNGRTQELTGSNLVNAAKYLMVDQEWLASGKGRMIPDSNKNIGNISPSEIKHTASVPLISWVQAGEWCEASDPFIPGEADEWLSCPVKHSEYTYALKVHGDSMTAQTIGVRSYPEGCIIFVDPLKKDPVNGDRVIACLEGSNAVTFKVFKQEDGRVWLEPINNRHEPIRDPFKVIGTVIGKWEE